MYEKAIRSEKPRKEGDEHLVNLPAGEGFALRIEMRTVWEVEYPMQSTRIKLVRGGGCMHVRDGVWDIIYGPVKDM